MSPALITAVTDSVLEDVKTWQNRPLDPLYPILYLDAIHLKIRIDGHVKSQAVYLALGITIEGKKELLGLWVGENEGAKFWMAVLTELKNRGVQDILVALVSSRPESTVFRLRTQRERLWALVWGRFLRVCRGRTARVLGGGANWTQLGRA